ncbi:MAG: SDR family oxidoreductase [Deltaproteobacteria bacterium]|nr:SDR family oxidoreductase [Deltaproteobacteria bacterium]
MSTEDGSLVRKKTVLITGATGKLAAAIIPMLAEQGWNLALCGRRAEPLERSRAELRGESVAACFVADLADNSATEELVDAVLSRFGRIDALIHAAGSYRREPLLEQAIADWHGQFADNLHSLYYLARAVAPTMKAAGWGRIVSFGLVNAERLAAQPMITAHSIAKTGVLILTRTLAQQLGPFGITANVISPGYLEHATQAGEAAQLLKRIPSGRLGRGDDICGVLALLLSERADYINGANVTISGGWGL